MPATASRETLIARATLNALVARYPASTRFYGRAAWSEKLYGLVRDEFEEGAKFCADVRAEYRRLLANVAEAA